MKKRKNKIKLAYLEGKKYYIHLHKHMSHK